MRTRGVKKTMNVFLFTGYNRIDLLEIFQGANCAIQAIVVPKADKYLHHMDSLIRRAIVEGIPVMTKDTLVKDRELMKLAKKGLLYSSGYPLLLKQEIVQSFRHAVNCHPTLLPAYRGKYMEYILLNNEMISGTTIHHIDEGCDNGPIIMQESYSVELTDNVLSLRAKSAGKEEVMLKKILSNPQLLETREPQDESMASTYLTQRTPADSMLEEGMSLREAYLRSRAFDEVKYPGYFMIGNLRIEVRMNASIAIV